MSKCWDYLVDHVKELMAANKEELIAQYNELGAVLKKVNMPSMDNFVNIYGKILVNSFSLRSDRYRPCSIANYLHHCMVYTVGKRYNSREILRETS